MKNFVFTFLIAFSFCTLKAQDNFFYSPANPKPGDLITFTYIPSRLFKGQPTGIEAIISISTATNSSIDNIRLRKNGNRYTGNIQTQPGDCFIYFGFFNNGLFDNDDKGYHIILKENNRPVKWAYWGLTKYWLEGFQWLKDNNVAQKNSASKALALNALSEEINNNLEAIDVLFDTYISLLKKNGREDTAKELINAKIKTILEKELITEDQYIILQNLFRSINMPEKADSYYALQKEKFPQGAWYYNDLRRKFRNEKDPKKMFDLLFQYRKSGTELSGWENYIIAACLRKKSWDTVKIVFDQYTSKDSFSLNMQYVWVANTIVSDKVKEMYDYGIELTSKAMSYFKNATLKKPKILPPLTTSKMWYERAKNEYAEALNVHAKILFLQNLFSKADKYVSTALRYKKEVMQPLSDVYSTYALIKEKMMDHKLLKIELEAKIKEGLNSPIVDSVLKRIYKENSKNDEAFVRYLNMLKNNNYNQAVTILKKTKLNESAPLFSLYNIQGNEVKLSSFKGKVVLLDFWYTKCGPCLQLFPLMKKLMNKYKNDTTVVFLYINSNETERPRHQAVKEFLASNNYSFETLIDDDDSVSQRYGIKGFPTKIVINKSGNISFRSVGTSFNEVAFMNEMSAMIELAKKD